MPDAFSTITTEGVLLPPDFLQRISANDRDIAGLRAEDYHLGAGERLNETIGESWARLKSRWASFKTALEKLAETDNAVAVTRERWLLPLFQELGYGRLMPVGKATEASGKPYPISHFWNHSPIHLVGCRLNLDERSPSVPGAARMTPHGMVQEFLNRSDDHLWGFLSNGYRLRILRDNASLTRQAYVEFDLQAMLEEEVYADFALLWLLCHQSRVETERPELCWLEKWSQTAQKEGTRILEHLRVGVQRAIAALGSGFLAHPANRALKDKLRAGTLDKQDYYHQLLHTVYRLIFLFVTEDRGLLLDPNAPADAKSAYTQFYSTQRLRKLAGKLRGARHHDLWEGLALVMDKLCSSGCPELALPAFGSFLWSPAATADLNGCKLPNQHQLDALRHLAYIDDAKTKARRPVDYKNLGSEELGSIYESLLELHPEIHADAALFELKTAAGNERKTSGSYYTPTSLINCLLNSALDPVLDEAAKKPDAERAILNLKICDPACGSGHFLVAAAHRVARRLASVRTGDEEPSPEAVRKALRDVIGHCIYGVDLNPWALELCKFNLWLEAVEPGKPLSFLDHHIQCGNSLLGATPALLAKGVPDEAFEAITGDEKKYCSELKKKNKKEREDERSGQGFLAIDMDQPHNRLGDLAAALTTLDALPDDTLAATREKERRYAELVSSSKYEFGRLWADAWCAAFVWKKVREKDGGLPFPVTERYFRLIEHKGPHGIQPWMIDEIKRLAKQYQFFHWHLAFPDVFRLPKKDEGAEYELSGWDGGFDVVLGNPPWDTLSPDAKEFFAVYDPQVRIQNSDGQKFIIDQLLQSSAIANLWNEYCRDLYALVHFIKQSGRYVLFAPGNLGKGDFNIYRMFVEAALSLTRKNGWTAQIVPEGLYNGANCMAIRRALYEACRLACLFGFENTNEIWFPGVHTAMKFCLYAAKIGSETESFQTAFNVHSPDRLTEVSSGQCLNMPVRLVKEFSPDALAIMELGSQQDIDIAAKMYRWPAFGSETSGPPSRVYMREIDMGTDRDLFNDDSTGVPLYEGRMVDQFDHRAKGYRSGRGREAVWEALPFDSPAKSIQPQWYVAKNSVPDKCKERIQKYRIGFCDVASPTNERTLIAALVPPDVLCGHSVPTILLGPEGNDWYYPLWLAIANSCTMDFVARTKVSLHMTFSILDSLPFPRLGKDDPRTRELVYRSLRLLCTGTEMIGFWNRLAVEGWIPATANVLGCTGEMNDDARLQLRAEIDAIVAHDIFNLTRQEVEYILDTFPTQRRYQEEQYGEYRSRRLILEFYDDLKRAIETGVAYQTRLTLPPADASVAHPAKIVANSPVEVTGATRIKQTGYPQPGRDRIFCAMAYALIKESGSISTPDHIDALNFATHPEWCDNHLSFKDKKSFRDVLAMAPSELKLAVGELAGWKQIRNYLKKFDAIAIDNSERQSLTVAGEIPPAMRDTAEALRPMARFILKACGDYRSQISNGQPSQQAVTPIMQEVTQCREAELAAAD